MTVGRAGEHLVAHGLIHRDGLTRHRGLIDRRGAFDHHAIGGNVLAGANQEPVTDHHLVDIHFTLGALSVDDGHPSGCEVQQLGDGVAGAVLGELLEGLRDRVQERECSGFGPGAEGAGDDGGDRHQQLDADLSLGDQLLDRLGREEPGADQCCDDEQHRRHHTRSAERPGQVAGGDQQTAGRRPPDLP